MYLRYNYKRLIKNIVFYYKEANILKQYNAKNIFNIALAGHSGSGKTSLAEAMIYLAGGSERLGKVSDGNTKKSIFLMLPDSLTLKAVSAKPQELPIP